MSPAWRALADELARWRESGRKAQFWWRDDDAHVPSAALARLNALAAERGIPVALAVIPGKAEAALFDELDASACVLQHGVDHENRAGPGAKKTEFSSREPVAEALARLGAARERLLALAKELALPVLVPPWNRIPQPLAARLGEAGLAGLSTFGLSSLAGPSITQVNTHVDIVAWRGGRGFVGEEEVLGVAVALLAAQRRSGSAQPIGWLTHHGVHDASCWRFLADLLDLTLAAGVRWVSAREIFRNPPILGS